MSAMGARALLALVVSVSLVDLALFVREGGDVPDDAEYARAADAIRAAGFDAQQDAVAILPPWSLRPLVALGALPRVSGDALATQPLDRYRSLFVVVEPDGEEERDALAARLGAPTTVVATERIVVERFPVDAPAVVYDFRARVEDAAVTLVRADGTREDCTKKVPGGLSCSAKHAWRRVAREQLLVSENGDRAIWAHPPGPGDRVEIRFVGVPPASELVLRAGHTRTGSDGARAPVKLVVRQGEREILVREFPVRFDFATERIPWPKGGDSDVVTFAISTKNDKKQHWAFDAYLVGEAR